MLRLALILAFRAALAPAQSAFDCYLAGNPADVRTPTQPGFLLAGGGGDVDEAMRWFLERSGGGDIVVLRASRGDGYNGYLRKLARRIRSNRL